MTNVYYYDFQITQFMLNFFRRLILDMKKVIIKTILQPFLNPTAPEKSVEEVLMQLLTLENILFLHHTIYKLFPLTTESTVDLTKFMQVTNDLLNP